jgi:purine/pyrimidine-nucleoside phosphorylase
MSAITPQPAIASTLNGHIEPRANIYFDGKCISHSIELPGGVKKSVGVILPSTLVFNTQAPETMELVAGECHIKLAGQNQWQTYGAGQSFKVPAQSSFEIKVSQTLHYICHFEKS